MRTLAHNLFKVTSSLLGKKGNEVPWTEWQSLKRERADPD